MSISPPNSPKSARSPKYVRRIRETIVAAAEDLVSNTDDLASIFLIGSCSGDSIPDDWYQDFDIHFRFKSIVLGRDTLNWLGDLLHRCEAIQDDTCKVSAFLRDRHWKMVPDRRWAVNVGVHATLLNAADHARRVHYNPILSQNMYLRCAVLWGAHPRDLIGFRPSVPADYAHSVGGVSWMVENFTRMVALHILEPENRSFYPFVAGYCWNAASTLMFHLGTLETGGIYSRASAFWWLLGRPGLPQNIKEAMERLYQSREMTDAEVDDHRGHINAAARVVRYVAAEALALTGLNAGDAVSTIPRDPRVLYTPRVAAALDLEGPINLVESVVPDTDTDFYGAVSETVGELAKKNAQTSLSVNENFELLREAHCRGVAVSRLRLWTRGSVLRRRFSFDFAQERGERSLSSAVFNWEDGAQTLLQRLNELFIEKCTIDAELRTLTSAVARVVAQRFDEAGLHTPGALGEAAETGDFDTVCRALGEGIASHVMTDECRSPRVIQAD